LPIAIVVVVASSSSIMDGPLVIAFDDDKFAELFEIKVFFLTFSELLMLVFIPSLFLFFAT